MKKRPVIHLQAAFIIVKPRSEILQTYFTLHALHQTAQHLAAMLKIIIAKVWPVLDFGAARDV